MDKVSNAAESNENSPLEIRPSLKFTVVSLVGGITAIAFGLTLELYVYRRFAFQLRDIGIRLNGWWFVGIGSVFAWIGARCVIARPVILRFDRIGLHSPKQKLSIPWSQIQDIRGTVIGGGAKFLAVRVASLEEVPGADKSRRTYRAGLSEFSEDEVPIAVVGLGMDLKSIVEMSAFHFGKWQVQSE